MKLRLIAGTLAAFAGIAIAAPTPSPSPEGASASSVPDRLSRGPGPLSADWSARSAVRTAKCVAATPGLHRSIESRRSATWRWQDEIEVPRTRSSFHDRRAIGCSYLRWSRSLWAGRADAAYREYVHLRDDHAAAVCHVFGIYCSEAIGVAKCESGHSISPNAHNGQYLGAFQMGSSERALYGHGPTVLDQARAAYRYFVASGRDWSPWSCRWAAD